MEDSLTSPASYSQQTEISFDKEREALDRLISDWKTESDKVKLRRELRENKKNVQELREKGQLLPDETIIPDRTINLNIKRGKVPYISYTTKSRNTLIITDLTAPARSLEELQLWFTRGVRYPHWKIPWFRLIDCVHTHGGAALEVVYDPGKPFNCAIEYIPREALIIPKNTKSIQACARIIRIYEVTRLQLEEFRDKYQFTPEIVDKLLEKCEKNEDTITIYRPLFKRGGYVYNAWYAQGQTEWLRPPQLHDIGLIDFEEDVISTLIATPVWQELRPTLAKPLALSQYPIFWYKYEEIENEKLLEIQGRVALDIHTQEALTHLLTNTVNASTRASHIYASAEAEPGGDAKVIELAKIKPGVVMSRKVDLWQPPWPNQIILAITQVLDQRKAQESGHTDFAAMARKDANKTATEMELAVSQASDIASSDIDVYSSPYLDTYALVFLIARHQAIFELCHPPTDHSQLFGQFQLTPAGDTEVIKLEEDKRNAKEFFNLVKGTPLAEKLFLFLINHYFPDHAKEWAELLSAPNKDAIIAQLVQVLQSIPTDELTSDQRSALQSLIASASDVVSQSGNGNVSQPLNQPAPTTAAPSNAVQ